MCQSCLIPSLSELERCALANRGLEDGLAGRMPASHDRSYTSTYERGRLFRRATQSEVALTFGYACRCPSCGTVYEAAVGGVCPCTPFGAPVELGVATLYGPGHPDDNLAFYGADDLRRLVLDGVPVLTMDGERLNEQILVQ